MEFTAFQTPRAQRRPGHARGAARASSRTSAATSASARTTWAGGSPPKPHVRARLAQVKRELDPLVLETFEETLARARHSARASAPSSAASYLATVERLGFRHERHGLREAEPQRRRAAAPRFDPRGHAASTRCRTSTGASTAGSSGPDDRLAPNEAICPVCKVVIRSTRELREGDRVYCMPCMSRLVRGAQRHRPPRGPRRLLSELRPSWEESRPRRAASSRCPRARRCGSARRTGRRGRRAPSRA